MMKGFPRKQTMQHQSRLDVESEQFDALAALETALREGVTVVRLPRPNIRPLDNVAACRRLIPSQDFLRAVLSIKTHSPQQPQLKSVGREQQLQLQKNKQPPAEDNADQTRPPAKRPKAAVNPEATHSIATPIASSISKVNATPEAEENSNKRPAAADTAVAAIRPDTAAQRVAKKLQEVHEKASNGPMSLLHRCLRSGDRIVVSIRGARRGQACLRGTCQGLLWAFDKHMNLVLLDVTEKYVRWEFPKRADSEASLTSSASPASRSPSHQATSSDAQISLSSSSSWSSSAFSLLSNTTAGTIVSNDGSTSTEKQKHRSAQQPGSEKFQKKRLRRLKKLPQRDAASGKLPSSKIPVSYERHIGQLFIRGDQIVHIRMQVSISSETVIGQQSALS